MPESNNTNKSSATAASLKIRFFQGAAVAVILIVLSLALGGKPNPGFAVDDFAPGVDSDSWHCRWSHDLFYQPANAALTNRISGQH